MTSEETEYAVAALKLFWGKNLRDNLGDRITPGNVSDWALDITAESLNQSSFRIGGERWSRQSIIDVGKAIIREHKNFDSYRGAAVRPEFKSTMYLALGGSDY